ncbi:MAG: hypothetical protein DDT26_01200 [Dehalococcoidia bacterium]|nr:hypothetical protein [Chloroflexota bacterium]
MIQEVKLKVRDGLGNERLLHDEIRGVGKAFEDFSDLAAAAVYPARALPFILPETTVFTGVGANRRVAATQFAHLLTIHIFNRGTVSRNFEFFDGDPTPTGVLAGTSRKLLPVVVVLADSSLRVGADLLKGYICTHDLWVRPGGVKAEAVNLPGVEVSVSALIINRTVE